MIGVTMGETVIQGVGFRIVHFPQRRTLQYTGWFNGKVIGFYNTEEEAAIVILSKVRFVT